MTHDRPETEGQNLVQLEVQIERSEQRRFSRGLNPCLARVLTLRVPVLVIAFNGHVQIKTTSSQVEDNTGFSSEVLTLRPVLRKVFLEQRLPFCPYTREPYDVTVSCSSLRIAKV